MSDLRLIGRSSDGNNLELESHDGTNFTLPLNDELRTLINQPRLVAVSSKEEQSALTVKEVQARLRGGETIDSISRTTDWTPEKIEKFSGPILQERAYVIGLALASQLRKEKHAPTLAAATIAQLEPRGVDMTQVEWNTWRLPEGSWNIVLLYPNKDGVINESNWNFDFAKRGLEASDDGAAWISGEEIDTRSHIPSHGIVYPSPTPAPRLVAVRTDVESSIHITQEITHQDQTNQHETNQDETNQDERRDGVTKRLKIPSWDDIMFGSSKEPSEEE